MKAKKILSTLLAVMLAFGLTVPASAAEAGEIKDGGNLPATSDVDLTLTVVDTGDSPGCQHLETSWKDNGDGTHNEVCDKCGEILTENEAHVGAEGGACDTCGGEIKSCYHPNTHGEYNGDMTHNVICDDCFASDGSGLSTVVTENEPCYDDDGDDVCDECGNVMWTGENVLVATVPLKLPILTDFAGNVETSTTAKIENHTDWAIDVSAIQVDLGDGWAMKGMDYDFTKDPYNTKNLAMSFRGDEATADGSVSLTQGNWTIGGKATLGLDMKAKLSMWNEAMSETSIGTVHITLDWATDHNAESSHNHNWGQWTFTTKPTEDAGGVAERVCLSESTHIDSVHVSKLTNTEVWQVKAHEDATDTDEGYTTYTSVYGDITVKIPATGSGG